jgi:hypothetical protein
MAKHGPPDQFPDDGSILNRTHSIKCPHTAVTDEDSRWIAGVSFGLVTNSRVSVSGRKTFPINFRPKI